MPMPTTPKEFLAELHDALITDPYRTEAIHATFALEVTGPHGGRWWIEAADGTGAVHEGTPDDPIVTVQLADDVLVRLGNHELDGAEAYVEGLLEVRGDASKAVFLGQVFGE